MDRDDVWTTDSKIRAGATARQIVNAMRALQTQHDLSALRVTKSAVRRRVAVRKCHCSDDQIDGQVKGMTCDASCSARFHVPSHGH
jgi:hypothetical protein